MSAAHKPCDCDQLWDSDQTTVSRPVTAELAVVLDLLEVPHNGGRARASVAVWRRIDAVAAWGKAGGSAA